MDGILFSISNTFHIILLKVFVYFNFKCVVPHEKVSEKGADFWTHFIFNPNKIWLYLTKFFNLYYIFVFYSWTLW